MKKKSITLIAAGAILALGLTGCTAPAEEQPEKKPASTEQAAPEETPTEEAPAATGDTPEWAEGSLDVGDSLGEITTDSWKVQVFQVGTAKTTKDSMFVDKESGKNLLPTGAEVVYVNFVFTNTSGADIQLGSSLGSPSVTSSTWKYMGGQPSFSDTATYESMKLSADGKQTGFEKPFVVAAGQSFAQATNIAYVAGDKVEAEVRVTPVDDAGDLVHDKREEATAALTIK